MTKENGNILAVLLDVKENDKLDIKDQLIRDCYEIQKKYQFDPNRSTVEKMRVLVESSLKKESDK